MVTSRPSNGNRPASNIPIPDPSLLTTEQLRRELASLKEVLETRIGGVEAILEERGTDRDRFTTESEKRIQHLRELQDEKFAAITLQFAERDVRAKAAETAAKEATAALSVASTTAVNAALQAQKESAFATQQSNAEAIRKSELGFSNEITALKSLINATKEGLTATVADLRSRLDRGEGSTTGVKDARDETHMTVGTIVGIIGGITGALSLVALVAFGVANITHAPPPSTVLSPAMVPLAPPPPPPGK